MAEGVRATKSYVAALDLCESGYGPQAAMLNRSIFEGSMIAHWVSGNVREAEKRYAEHHRLSRIIWADKLRVELEDPPDDEERAALEAQFGRFGHKLWTGHSSIHALVKDVKHLWEHLQGGPEGLQEFLKIAYHDANLRMHSTSWGLDEAVRGKDGKSVEIKLGPSEDYLSQAYYGAYFAYSQTLTLLADFFEMPRREELAAFYAASLAAFHQFTKADVQDVGRNDPCPCGSGKKFKKCHLGVVEAR